ncbi:MAG: helix-turn-helix domain-containing protein [Candidatus Saccharimonadales bacterium]
MVATKVFKALGDDVRLTIVQCLARGDKPLKYSDIASRCDCVSKLSQPTISHHINKLASAEVILVSKQRTENFYTLNREGLSTIGIDTKLL